jgi:hypothetical protein
MRRATLRYPSGWSCWRRAGAAGLAAPRDAQEAPAESATNMQCERCCKGEEARYCVYTEAMEMTVCAACTDEARKLGISVERRDQERKPSCTSPRKTEQYL